MRGYIMILSFLAAFFGVYFLYLASTSSKRRILGRLETYTSKKELIALLEREKEGLGKGSEGDRGKVKNILAAVSQIFKSKKASQRVEGELFKADIPLKGEEYITIVLLATLGPPLLIILTTQNLLFAGFLALLGFLIPRLLVQRAKGRRLAKFNDQLPDALVMLANSLRAGFSFFQAVELISREMPRPISLEFGRMLREMNLGISTEEALGNMCKRLDSEDLEMVVTAVLIQRQVGGNLAQVLDNISHTIRERVRIKGEIRTLTAQGRISGLIIGLLPVALIGVLLAINPSYATLLFTTKLGLAMVAGAVVSQSIGMLLIRQVVDIKV